MNNVYSRKTISKQPSYENNGGKVYHCSFDGCGYTTMRAGHLRRHERTHTHEKPYCCKYCSYQASRSDHLKRHERIHERTLSSYQIHLSKRRPVPPQRQYKEVAILPRIVSIDDGGKNESKIINS